MGRVVAGIALLTLIAVCAAPVRAEEAAEQVRVADSYLDIRTGPGRGYPVFHIAERGERVIILRRRTDWFKIRTAGGKTGWVSREQMERTLTEAGVAKTFRDVLYEDYLQRRFEGGFLWGQMGGDTIDGRDTVLTAALGYRFSDNQTLELVYSHVTDDFFGATFLYASLVSQPYPSWTVAPTFSLGFGRAKIEPRTTLINAPEVDAKMANAGIGARVYFTRRFFARFDYKAHRVFVDDAERTDSYRETSLGVGFFF